jgi:hypothetical protein
MRSRALPRSAVARPCPSVALTFLSPTAGLRQAVAVGARDDLQFSSAEACRKAVVPLPTLNCGIRVLNRP